jgi:hypothetical protein
MKTFFWLVLGVIGAVLLYMVMGRKQAPGPVNRTTGSATGFQDMFSGFKNAATKTLTGEAQTKIDRVSNPGVAGARPGPNDSSNFNWGNLLGSIGVAVTKGVTASTAKKDSTVITRSANAGDGSDDPNSSFYDFLDDDGSDDPNSSFYDFLGDDSNDDTYSETDWSFLDNPDPFEESYFDGPNADYSDYA